MNKPEKKKPGEAAPNSVLKPASRAVEPADPSEFWSRKTIRWFATVWWRSFARSGT